MPSEDGGVLVLGGGQAAFQLAASLREEGFAGPVTLVGQETAAPYQRPPLSKAFLSGEVGVEALDLRPGGFYAERGIALRPGETAVAIERDRRRVHLASGEILPYGHLVLALGARNRPLPVTGAGLPNVVGLRDLSDARALRAALVTARRLVVIGAGFIGLECAAAAAPRGVEVTVVEATSRPMARTVSSPMAEAFRAHHEARGVRFAFGETVIRIAEADGRAVAVETASGAVFPADLVLVGIGVVPNSDLAAEAGLPVRGGILVNEHMLTADPAISAIGDCAAYPLHTGPACLESVQAAVDGARCVAARLAGRPKPYSALPWFWSDQGGLKLQIAGLGAGHDLAVTRGDPETGGFSVFLYRAGQLVAVESAGRPADHMQARRILAAGLHVPPDAAADPAFQLRSVGAGERAA